MFSFFANDKDKVFLHGAPVIGPDATGYQEDQGTRYSSRGDAGIAEVATLAGVRVLKIEDLRNMTGKQIADLLAGPAILKYDRQAGTDSLGELYIGTVTDRVRCTVSRLRQEIIDSGAEIKTSNNDSSAQYKISKLNMLYPIMAYGEAASGDHMVVYKVPSHIERFNSRAYGIDNFEYVMPDLMFSVELTPTLMITRAFVYVIIQDSIDPSMIKLGHLPFPNVFSSNGICMGSASLESSGGAPKNIGDAIIRFTSLFLQSNWKNDLPGCCIPDNLDEEYAKCPEKPLDSRRRSDCIYKILTCLMPKNIASHNPLQYMECSSDLFKTWWEDRSTVRGLGLR